MIICSEKYREKLDLVDKLMQEREQLSTTIKTHTQRLKVIEENIRALNLQIKVLEKELILQRYNN